MLSNSERGMVESYLKGLAETEEKRAQLTEQLHRLESAVRGILALTDDEKEYAEYLERLDGILKPTGLTDAIRKVFRRNPKIAFSPADVQFKIKTMGFSLTGQSNPLASIHTILKRLAEAGQIKRVRNPEGKIAYRALPIMWQVNAAEKNQQ